MSKRQGDRFTSDKFAWLDQVLADAGLLPICFMVAYAIAKWVQRDTWAGWRSQEDLAADCHVSVVWLGKAIDMLQMRGHLEVISGNGRGKASTYRWVLKSETPVSPFEPEKEQSELPLSAKKGATPVSERCNSSAGKGETAVGPNPIRESWKNPGRDKHPAIAHVNGSKRAAFSNIEIDHRFEHEFWVHYPRKVAKDNARKAFVRVVKSGRATPEELLAGVLRYAAERTGEDPKFTKHPATWLNGGCWQDDSAPSFRAPVRQESAAAAVRDLLGDD
jgi:hypothetical protein